VNAANPLRVNRDFRLLWFGQTVSVLGSRVSAFALPLLVLSFTASPALAGVVAFVGGLPFLVWQLPAGGLVDRWDRKRTMIWCDLGRAVAVLSIALALWAGHLTMPQVLIVAFVEGSLFVFFNLAQNAAVPNVVSGEQLPRALAQNEAGARGTALAGGPIGGVLFGVSRALPFVFDAVSFLVSIGTVAATRSEFRSEARGARDKLHREVAEGFRWLWHNPFIRATSLLFAGANFIVNAVILAVIVVARGRGATAAETGLITSFIGVGALLGALVAARAQRHIPPRAIVIGTTWIFAVLVAAIGVPGPPIMIAPIIGVLAFTVPTLTVLVSTYELSLIPDRLLGRVESVILLLAWGSIPFGSLISGSLLEWFGFTPALFVLGGLMAVVALAVTISPAIRDMPALPGTGRVESDSVAATA
jgi:predicted MFS family arabinose efflux permease